MEKKDNNNSSEKNRNIGRNEKVENRIIISIIFIFLMGALGETPLIKYVPDFLIIKNHDLSELSMIVFQTHATVATLGIAVIALLSGTNNEYHYGISISNYILNIKPKFLNLIGVILSLLLSMLVTYFLAIFGHYNILIAIFIITIILIIKLICDISIVFNGNDYLKNELSSYIIKEYQNEHVIKLLTKNSIENIDKPDTIKYRENMQKLYEVFEKVVEVNFKKVIKKSFKEKLISFFKKHFLLSKKENTTEQKKDIYDMKPFWENSLTYVFQHSFINLKSDNLNYAFEFLNKFYEVLKSKNLYNFTLWNNIYYSYFKAVSSIDNISEVKTYIFIDLRYYLYNTIDTSEKENDFYYIYSFSSRLYYTYLYKLNENIKSNTKIKLFNEIQFHIDNFTNDDKKTNLLQKELRQYIKVLIDNGEDSVLNETFIKILYVSTNINMNLSLLSIIIYLFYISENEPLVTEELKKFSSKFISDNKNIIASFLYNFDTEIITRENVELIFDYIADWEFIPDKDFVVKSMILVKYINSFLIFLSLYKEHNSEKLKNALESIVGKSSLNFVSNYTRQNNPDSIKDYECIVRNLFDPYISDEDIENDFYRLENLLFDIYRQDEFTKGIKRNLKEEKKKELEENINSKLKESILDKINLFNSQIFEGNYKEVTCSININTYTSFIESSMQQDIDFFLNKLFYSLLKHLIDDKSLIFKNVSYRDKQALVKLFDCIHSLRFNVDTIIGYRDWFYDYEKIENFNELLENSTKIKFPSINNIVVLDKSKLSLKDLNCSIEIEDVDFDKFIKTQEVTINKDGKYLYNITNSIFLPFEKDELREHIKNTRKNIKCVIKYKYDYQGDKIGAGIIFDGQF